MSEICGALDMVIGISLSFEKVLEIQKDPFILPQHRIGKRSLSHGDFLCFKTPLR